MSEEPLYDELGNLTGFRDGDIYYGPKEKIAMLESRIEQLKGQQGVLRLYLRRLVKLVEHWVYQGGGRGDPEAREYGEGYAYWKKQITEVHALLSAEPEQGEPAPTLDGGDLGRER